MTVYKERLREVVDEKGFLKGKEDIQLLKGREDRGAKCLRPEKQEVCIAQGTKERGG